MRLRGTSARRPDAGEHDGAQPSDRRVAGKRLGCGERVQAIAREFGGVDVGTHRSLRHPFADERGDEVGELVTSARLVMSPVGFR